MSGFCFIWRLFHLHHHFFNHWNHVMSRAKMHFLELTYYGDTNAVHKCCSLIFFSGSFCQRADYCSLDPFWLVSGLTRAVGQGRWPPCGSYPALKSILEGHIAKCTSPNTLQLCRSTGFGFHIQTRHRDSRVELWSGKAWMYCTNRHTKAALWWMRCNSDSAVAFDSWGRQDVGQIQTAWCQHSIRDILF